MDYEKLQRHVTVEPGKKISLRKDYSTLPNHLSIKKSKAKEMLAEGIQMLAEFQEKLYAQDTYSLLLIFQAMDAAGKDGTIKHVMSGLNPQGCDVHSFKAPSTEELDHDFLWRCYKALPERGRIGIFNRSYYEEVLVVRVHPEILEKQKLPPEARSKKIWEQRYEQINNFEKHLVQNGTIILKFFLNVSKDEQKRRFLERIDMDEKNWKFSVSDAKERQHWDAYMQAYEDCFNHTSTKWAPWHIIPADNKPVARLKVALLIWRKLEELGLHYPQVTKAQKEELLAAKKVLENE